MTTENGQETSYIPYLTQAGLDKDQATIYECLIKNGQLPAGKISQKTPIKRGLVYKILESLVEMGLVIKHEEPKKVAVFEPAHPLKLKELAEKKEEQAKSAQDVLDSIMQSLVLSYGSTSAKPGILFLPGLEGLSKVYEIILKKRAPLKILASNLDRDNKKISELIDKQIARQHSYGITTKSIGSSSDSSLSQEQVKDLKNKGIELKKINSFLLPSQIIIFGDSIAITALTPELITTYIENEAIAKTMSIVFDQLWTQASDEGASSPPSSV
jgi:sugar-specific transcriptional regulator TrmB